MILIILPCKNESETIKKTAVDLYTWCCDNLTDFNILFIDDDSSDDTIQKIQSLKNEHIKIMSNKFDRGKGSALKAGYIYSTFMYGMNDDDIVIFMDGDGQIDPKDIKTFLNLMFIYGSDVVIGNKRHLYSSIRYSFKRKIVSKVYNFIIRSLFGFGFTDTQCGIKLFKKSSLEKVIDKIMSKRYAFDVELIVALREMNFRVIDSPVNLRKQLNSGSVKLLSIFLTFFDTLFIFWRMRRNFYKSS